MKILLTKYLTQYPNKCTPGPCPPIRNELSNFQPEKPGVIIINPPYGERLGVGNNLDTMRTDFIYL